MAQLDHPYATIVICVLEGRLSDAIKDVKSELDATIDVDAASAEAAALERERKLGRSGTGGRLGSGDSQILDSLDRGSVGPSGGSGGGGGGGGGSLALGSLALSGGASGGGAAGTGLGGAAAPAAGAPVAGAGPLAAAAAAAAGLGRKGGLHRVSSGDRERDALLGGGDELDVGAAAQAVHVRFDGGADR